MNGMLWYVDKSIPFTDSIKIAVAYYTTKYEKPELVLCSLADYQKVNLDELNIAVRSYQSVLPSHLWIGSQEILN